MEFTIASEDFLSAITRAQSIVERRVTMPILANVLLEAEGQSLTVKATDLEVGLAGAYPAKVKKAGKLTVPARKLYEILRELEEPEVWCKSRENNRLELKCGPSFFDIVGLEAGDYPSLPGLDASGYVSLSCRPLKEMLEMTVFAASMDETRYNLNGVFWEVKTWEGKKGLRLVATDGHRLALVDRLAPEIESFQLPKGVILSRKGVAELKSLLTDAGEEDKIQVCFQKNHGLFKRPPLFLVVRLIEGDFPDYDQVLPKTVGKQATMAREKFLAVLRRVSLLSAEKGRGVKFKFAEGLVEVSARNPDLGEAKESLAIEWAGPEELAIAFNARYIIDILSVLKADKITLEMTDELSPGVLRPVGDGERPGEGHLSLIMPMRL